MALRQQSPPVQDQKSILPLPADDWHPEQQHHLLSLQFLPGTADLMHCSYQWHSHFNLYLQEIELLDIQ